MEKIIYQSYRPRQATAEEARRYFLQNYCDAPDALFGTAMDKEAYLNAETPGWLEERIGPARPAAA